jgi:hypothetical protein
VSFFNLLFIIFTTSSLLFPRSSERVCKLLVSALNTNVPINENQFIASARAVIPKIQGLVTKMGKMIKLNCRVHINTYNIIIAEAARAKGGA